MSDLLSAIQSGKSDSIEFKRSTAELRRAVETICAFLNLRGGTVIFGVREDRTVVGQQVSDITLRTIADEIRRNIEPRIYPSIYTEEINGRTVVVVSVPEGRDKPYVAYRRPFKRVGTETQPMDHEEHNDLLREKDRYILFWDQEPCADAGLVDIDEKKLQRFLKIAIRARNLQINIELPLAEILEKLNLTKKGQITNAAIALFGKQPQRFFNHLEVRAARFKGTDKREFIENKVFDGDLFEVLERAEAFLNVYNQISSYIPKDSWQRVDRPEYPYDALREAVINALIHRDYYNRRATNSIAVFDDRIEIWNAGKLPPGYTIDTLKGPHSSVPNNPTIAQMFFLCGRIEKWGRGTQNIIEDCRKHGIPDPEFSENSGGIQVTFRKSTGVAKRVDFDKLNESQRKIIEYLLKHGKAKTAELAESIGVSKAAVRKNISRMSDTVEWVGSSRQDPTGFYQIKK